VPFAIAAEQYLLRPRQRPLNAIDVMRIQELTRHFRVRTLTAINEVEWTGFIDRRMADRAPVTRERYIDLLMSFLAWCQARPRQWIDRLPAIERDHAARQRVQRRARRVGELRPELVQRLVQHAPAHLKGQLAIMWSTGARVSSILYGCRICDYVVTQGQEQITFHDTKNGRTVTAAVHPWSAQVMREYLKWRGELDGREAPLFLTDRHVPYVDNGKAAGGQNKTAWHGMIVRTCRTLRRELLINAAELRRQGRGAEARARWLAVLGDIALLSKVTPHWFRHRLATVLAHDPRAGMEQGGWLDYRSFIGYTHDVPQRRRALVAAMDAPDTAEP
jgi:site-specific recombinase XerD